MRYTFNMLTMMKEKVNTHFSFPLRLDMSGYMEENLISTEKLRGEYMWNDKKNYKVSRCDGVNEKKIWDE